MKQLTLFPSDIRRLITQTRLDLDIAIAAHANDPWEIAQAKLKNPNIEGETD